MLVRTLVMVACIIAGTLPPQRALASDNPFQQAPFQTPPPNMAEHWWRNFKDPDYCRMVLCHGKCAYRGNGERSACTLAPLYPILSEAGCPCDHSCSDN